MNISFGKKGIFIFVGYCLDYFFFFFQMKNMKNIRSNQRPTKESNYGNLAGGNDNKLYNMFKISYFFHLKTLLQNSKSLNLK